MKLGNINDAPILEYDEDNAFKTRDYFFSQGKKGFENFDTVKEMGIDRCIIFLPRSFNQCKDIFQKCVKIYDFKSASTLSPVYLYDNKLLIALCPLGGPASANLIEELQYNGIKKFIACGSCGCLDSNINIRDTYFVPTDAIRDEGLSYHYLPASRTIETDPEVNEALFQSLTKFNQKYTTGRTWTIDAIYRETPNRTARRKQEGAIGVEMECSSLCAVAKYNNLQFGELLYFTDSVSHETWEWRLYDKVKLRTHVLNICIDAIMRL